MQVLRKLSRVKLSLLLSVPLAIGLATPTLAQQPEGTRRYTATLAAANGSGVSGTATLTVSGNQLTVALEARGLEANQLHQQHIHGFANNQANSTCPPPAADTNRDGLISLEEGTPFIGPALLPLEPYPTAGAQGTISFTRTYTVDAGQLLPLENRALELHGMTVRGQYLATLPIACGEIVPSQAAAPAPAPAQIPAQASGQRAAGLPRTGGAPLGVLALLATSALGAGVALRRFGR